MSGSFRAGAASVDVSPGPGVPLAGYPHFPRHNTGIHDPLIATCIVLDDGAERVAIVCMDMLFFSRKYVQNVRSRVASITNIPASNIMICCSHTHSAPWGSDFFELGVPGDIIHPEPGYIAMLQDKLTALISDACSGMFEARLSVNMEPCGKEKGVGGNRRNPEGPADPEVWTVGIWDEAGKLRACMVKYSLHPTIIHEDSTLVTADYPAYVRRHLEERFPGIVMAFAQGTSGDQSSRYFRQGQSFDEAERIGTAIGTAAGDALASGEKSRNPKLEIWSEPIELPLKALPGRSEMEKRVRLTRERHASLKDANAPYLDVQNANLTMLGEEDTLAAVLALERGDRIGFVEDELPGEVQVIRLGDARIVALPGEIFVDFGKRIQQNSPLPKTFVVTCANGILPGYVCTAEAYASGGYETGASLLTAEAGEIMTQTASEILKRSASGENK